MLINRLKLGMKSLVIMGLGCAVAACASTKPEHDQVAQQDTDEEMTKEDPQYVGKNALFAAIIGKIR